MARPTGHPAQSSAEDLSGSTTLEERVLMVWPLTLDAWAFAGLPIPDYERANTPIVIRYKSDESPDDVLDS